jgi:radical SAM protein with 4Fe4S-binding SPASM domain
MSENKLYPNELTTEEAKALVKDLAEYDVRVLLFSGGEPLLRHDLFEVARFASDSGIRAVLSTNGTLITEDVARQLKTAGFSYVGISLDGIGETNNKFRNNPEAFELATKGVRDCLKAGVRTGLRFTVTNYNYRDVPQIFDFVETEQIPRVCFYHLVYAGRGTAMTSNDLTHKQTREFMDYVLKKAEIFHAQGLNTEILTVDNHADAAYLYLKLKEKDPEKAEEALKLLKLNGGNSSGVGIACVDFNGYVHPDQFWQYYSLGNIRTRRFSEIWADNSQPLLQGLRNRKIHLQGKCADCRFLDICNGNLRVRAEAVYGDVWAPDPACYLTYEEIQDN